MKFSNLLLVVFITTFIQTGYADDSADRDKYHRPDSIPAPSSNLLTEEKVVLGKTLFFDNRVSRDKSMSCATCHSPAHRWSDGIKIPLGADKIDNPRRSPTVLNSAWLTALMWDGRASTLEQQALLPITTAHEMNYSVSELVERLKGIENYGPLFQNAFGDNTINEKRIVQALASYQRTLVSNIAPFDLWIAGDESAISETAKLGFKLFNDKAQCVACHTSWRFTDDSFHDVGLKSKDRGRGAVLPVEIEIMQFAFKTPSLRDLPIAGPFMHDGSMQDMEEVIKHYEEGGIKRPSLSNEMTPFDLTEHERKALIEFLLTLDGGPLTVEMPILP